MKKLPYLLLCVTVIGAFRIKIFTCEPFHIESFYGSVNPESAHPLIALNMDYDF